MWGGARADCAGIGDLTWLFAIVGSWGVPLARIFLSIVDPGTTSSVPGR